MSEMKLPRLPKSNYPDMTYQRRYIGTVYTPEQMKAYAEKAVLAERDACRKEFEECIEAIALKVEEMGMQGFGTLAIAAAIRMGND